jgi:hypothetical protein
MAMVCCDLPIGRGVGQHAPSIRLGDLDSSIALSLDSHRHLRTSIIDSIVREFAALFFAIPHRSVTQPAETAMVKRFQFGPVFFF